MRLLILGGNGMLGHQFARLAASSHEVYATVRRPVDGLPEILGVPAERVRARVDVTESLASLLDEVRPEAVVNCTGVVKPVGAGCDPVDAIAVNALAPHRLGRLTEARGIRLVQVSTDCVFDGTRGRYVEADPPNATDVYGRTKALGEVDGPRTITVRTSMIGRELAGARGLLEWFLSHRGGTVDGFAEARFSGLSTAALGRVLLGLVTTHTALTGVYHVAADPINKYDLLCRLNVALEAHVDIHRRETPRIDRTLDGQRFQRATGFTPPSWDEMIAELAGDRARYDHWRNRAA